MGSARERILDCAYEVFSTRGVRSVGVDDVILRADLANATLYRHFPSRDALVVALLHRREEVWTHGWIEAEARRHSATARDRLLAIFDDVDNFAHAFHILMRARLRTPRRATSTPRSARSRWLAISSRSTTPPSDSRGAPAPSYFVSRERGRRRNANQVVG